MLIGLFLLYLAAFIAVVYSVEWLSAFLAKATVTDTLTFAAASAAATAACVLAQSGLGGITITVAVMAFWSLLLFGADRTTVAATLDIAAITLVAAAAAALSKSVLRRVFGSRL